MSMVGALQPSCSGRLCGEASTSGRGSRLAAAAPWQQQGQRSRQQRRRQRLAVAAAVTAETAAAPPSTPVMPRGGRGPASDASAPLSPDKVLFPDIQLPLYDPSEATTFDIVVVGSGPAGLAVADRVAQAGFKVRFVKVGRRCPAQPACRGRSLPAGWAVRLQQAALRRLPPPCPLICRGLWPRISPSPALPPQVLIVDPNPLAPWVNNFGVWIDEFELMGLTDCLDYTWDRALVYLDSGADGAR